MEMRAASPADQQATFIYRIRGGLHHAIAIGARIRPTKRSPWPCLASQDLVLCLDLPGTGGSSGRT